jgi:hypothetical protein
MTQDATDPSEDTRDFVRAVDGAIVEEQLLGQPAFLEGTAQSANHRIGVLLQEEFPVTHWRIHASFFTPTALYSIAQGRRGTRRTLGPQRNASSKPQRGFTTALLARINSSIWGAVIAFPNPASGKCRKSSCAIVQPRWGNRGEWASVAQGARHSRDPGLWNLTPLAY